MIRNFKFKLIITIVLSVLFVNMFIPFFSNAVTEEYWNPKQFEDSSYDNYSSLNIVGYHPNGATKNGTVGDLMYKIFGIILGLVRIVSLGYAIIMLIAIAGKYMTGSAQIKSQIKTDIPTYLIGAVVLFGANGILTIINYFVQENFN